MKANELRLEYEKLNPDKGCNHTANEGDEIFNPEYVEWLETKLTKLDLDNIVSRVLLLYVTHITIDDFQKLSPEKKIQFIIKNLYK